MTVVEELNYCSTIAESSGEETFLSLWNSAMKRKEFFFLKKLYSVTSGLRFGVNVVQNTLQVITRKTVCYMKML